MGHAVGDVPDVVDVGQVVEVRAPISPPARMTVSTTFSLSYQRESTHSRLVGALDSIARMFPDLEGLSLGLHEGLRCFHDACTKARPFLNKFRKLKVGMETCRLTYRIDECHGASTL